MISLYFCHIISEDRMFPLEGEIILILHPETFNAKGKSSGQKE
jgi:hypothetical protein